MVLRSVVIFVFVVCYLGTQEVFTVAEADSKTPLCRGAFDLYFILDRSTSVSKHNFQVQTVNFVHNISGFFISPKLMISLISFATTATTDLKLTGDRDRIRQGLIHLKMKRPAGNTFLHLGLSKAIEQIKMQGRMSASVIIVLTDGEVSHHRQRAIDTANCARDLGAAIFVVGVDDYKIDDLRAIANQPASDYVFTADSYDALNKLVTSIVKKTCIEIVSAEPSHICVGEEFEVLLTGSGFTKTDNISKVFCRFQQNLTQYHVTKPSKVTPTHLTCPAPAIEIPDSSVILQVSVNGKTFVSSNVTVTSKSCQEKESKDFRRIILIFFLSLLFLILLLLWWFWKLLPCSKSDKDVFSDADEPAGPKKKKWPTVDISFYGGGGVGGVKPVRVNWGDKGATEAGKKLSHPHDAKVIVDSTSDCGESDEGRKRGCAAAIKEKFLATGLLIQSCYEKIASRRPTKEGRNKLYSSTAERYERPRSSTST